MFSYKIFDQGFDRDCPKLTHPREALYLGVGPGLVWSAIAKPVSPENQYGPQSEVCDTIKTLSPSIYSNNPNLAMALLAACC